VVDKPQINDLLQNELDESWQVDQQFFDESCIEYEIKGMRIKDWTAEYWVPYILLGIFTVGIMFILSSS